MTYRQTRAELEEQLRHQIDNLRTSSEAFDAGASHEAARLAVTFRVLLHDSRTSYSLLGQLGVKDRLRFVDTALDDSPGNLASHEGLTMKRPGAHREGIFVAPLDDLSPRRQNKPRKPFDEWWGAVVIRDLRGGTFTRRDLTLALANKEGGAHVDPELEPSMRPCRGVGPLAGFSWTASASENS